MLVSTQKEIDKYYKALIDRDPEFVGIFYVGVKTTGIFCISTCRARKPKPENVEFFTEVKDALKHGYRPCKICQPTVNNSTAPDEISKAIKLVTENAKEKVSDAQLRKEGLQPEKIRRWFKKNYGITYQAYQRMIRINTAFQELKNGSNVTESAYNSGYESLSGFGYTFKKMIGSAPKKSYDKDMILITRLDTPLGPMYGCATDKGVCLLEFTDRRMLETEFEDLQKRLGATIIVGENEHLVQLKNEIGEYFEGSRRTFDVKLHTPASDFQQSVWELLLKIPYGQTSSYQQQAIKLKKPEAIRAVATANGKNRVAIIIPCHRVIGKDGKLVGYAGGLERKKWLLEHEQKHSGQQSLF